eukprot:7068427-Pyramimonas_sp.AAC.1
MVEGHVVGLFVLGVWGPLQFGYADVGLGDLRLDQFLLLLELFDAFPNLGKFLLVRNLLVLEGLDLVIALP